MRYAKRGDASYDNRGLLSDIKLYLSDGTLYEYSGIYDYTAQSISPTSGTITLVVDFPNPQQRLKAGEFARIETGIGSRQMVVTIPQQAVMRTQGISSVWVVKDDNTVEYRQITTAETIGERWIVTDGLMPGERVAVTGLQKLHNGDKVSPQKTK
jgi:RND family efflux transporter MFP subunit